jgi:hypothetical protein
MREGDALRLVAVEQALVGGALHDGGEFPGEVDRIAHAGVHALAAGRTVDVAGIAAQEHAPGAEVLGDAVVDAVGREPVDIVDRNAGVALDIGTDRLEANRLVRLMRFRHDADQPDRARLPHRHDDGKTVGADGRVHAVAGDVATAFHVGDIEGLLVGAAGEVDVQPMAHRAVGAVATGKIGGADGFGPAFLAQGRDNRVISVLEGDEFGAPLDLDAPRPLASAGRHKDRARARLE